MKNILEESRKKSELEISNAYRKFNGHMTKAARSLNLSRAEFVRRIESSERLLEAIDEIELEWFDDAKLLVREAAMSPKASGTTRSAYFASFKKSGGGVGGLTPLEKKRAISAIEKNAKKGAIFKPGFGEDEG